MEDNLIKLDELGHDDPTMIKMLEDLTGIKASDIKLGDPGTMAIFTSPLPLGLPENDEIIGATGSIGIPEFGTPLTRQMLCDTRPKDFDTLVRLSGYSHGELVWIGNAKDLIQSGKASVSDTISCRDDIMLFLISKGMDDRYAFKISESVRKGNGLPNGAEEEMIRFRVPGWYIGSCKKIKYLFPKAHAVAYVMMAFRIAWFKVHKPLEFYSAYFYRRSRNNSFDAEYMTRGIDVARAKIKEIRNMTDVTAKDEELLITLEACYEFYLRGFGFADIDLYCSDSVRFLIVDDKKLRPPFVSVGGLGETEARDIVENRVGHEFISIDELSAACTKVSKTHLEQLRALGALRNLPESSQMSLF
jgi:DNA polymerase-3 subunit alpha (Gram-positive type)